MLKVSWRNVEQTKIYGKLYNKTRKPCCRKETARCAAVLFRLKFADFLLATNIFIVIPKPNNCCMFKCYSITWDRL